MTHGILKGWMDKNNFARNRFSPAALLPPTDGEVAIATPMPTSAIVPEKLGEDSTLLTQEATQEGIHAALPTDFPAV